MESSYHHPDGDRRGAMPSQRRIATAPVSVPSTSDMPQSSLSSSVSSSLSSSASSSLLPSRSEDLVETLYNHPSVKIIAFTSSQRSSFGSAILSETEVQPGTLSASSRLERTIAVGPFRIYRAPGSVAFLSCGSALQPILPKSQCWCIDELNGRFVLQIRRPQYWRIELPLFEPDDAQRAFILRDVFDSILLFEKTECPFQRSFHVELPQRPETPVRKKAWTPEGKNLIASPFRSDLSQLSTSPTPVFRERSATLKAESSSPESGLTNDAKANHNGQMRIEDLQETGPAKAVGYHGNPSLSAAQDRDEGAQARHMEESTVSPPSTKVDHSDSTSQAVPATKSTSDGSHSSEIEPIRDTKSASLVGTLDEHRDVTRTDQKEPAIRDILTSVKSTGTGMNTRTISQQELTEQWRTNVSRTEPSHEVRKQSSPVRSPVAAGSVMLVEKGIPQPPESASIGEAENRRQAAKPPATTTFAHSTEIVGDSDSEPSSFEGSGYVAPVNLTRKRMSRMLAGRSFPARQLTVVTSSPSKPKENQTVPKTSQPAAPQPSSTNGGSPFGSTDSFHSVQSWHSPITPLPPSPPSSPPTTASPALFPHPHENIVISRREVCSRDAPDFTTSPNTNTTLLPSSPGATDRSDEILPAPRSPAQTDEKRPDNPSVDVSAKASYSSAVEERPQAKHRSRPSNLSISRQPLSPLTANLFSPVRQPESRFAAVRRLPSAIINKTVEILLRPPSHLVNLMLKVAAKIAAGEWRGLVFGLGEGGEQIPVEWDYSDGEFSSWEDDDDYDIDKLRHENNMNIQRTSKPTQQDFPGTGDSGSWEVD